MLFCEVCFENSLTTVELDCDHKFCANCVYNIYRVNANLKCPKCRRALPETFKEIDIDFDKDNIKKANSDELSACLQFACVRGKLTIAKV